ncbi:STAS domain-containing protein [Natribacillus halophilus]|uniref:Anti-anti-sigma regulatory factor (Antagonist of anti-sigma factor) n=1 Tax=Natribacillus halophilus TaxID=549003 RepID=A0A1G8NTS3_9BACI|nr:STAS domain-containing protein [Natribacillus halophilus]SDI83634.1 Anti-anti-sigma regulatory factor (antagonist of anti-sigma factor) [Natribacillus halophilus]
MSAQRATNHRSVPILKVTKNIGLLPLLVSINDTITQDVLQQSSEKTYAHLIIDLSGIPSNSPDKLSRMILALEHIGVNVIVSGLRPDTAQKIGHDGMIPLDTKRCFPDIYHALTSLDVPMEPREAEK